MRRVYRVYIALAICLLIAAGLAGFPWEGRLRPELGSTSEQELQKVKLLLPWSMQAQFAGPVVAAKPKGAYERERLLVEIEPGGFAVNTPMEVAQGNAEFGIVQPDQLILAQTQLTGSNRLRAIAIIFKESMTCFMVRTTSGIKTVSDFRGRRVGTKETTNVDVEFRAMLQKAGVRSAEMELIPVQYDIGLFISGRIDIFPGFVINEPYIARKAGIETELLKPSQFGVS
ncbi:MAG: ABC transporter substrate-binding protein, partial [Halobacteriota archaeon]